MAKKPSKPAASAPVKPSRTAAPVAARAANPSAGAAHAAFMQATRGMAKVWNESRKVQDTGGSYETPEIPDGEYICQLTSCRVDAPQIKKGKNQGTYQALMEFRYVVREEESNGVQLRVTHWLTETEWRTLKDSLDRLFKDLQRLGYETLGMEVKDLFSVAEELSEAKPYVSVTCKTKEKDGKSYLNVYLNKIVDPADHGITA